MDSEQIKSALEQLGGLSELTEKLAEVAGEFNNRIKSVSSSLEKSNSNLTATAEKLTGMPGQWEKTLKKTEDNISVTDGKIKELATSTGNISKLLEDQIVPNISKLEYKQYEIDKNNAGKLEELIAKMTEVSDRLDRIEAALKLAPQSEAPEESTAEVPKEILEETSTEPEEEQVQEGEVAETVADEETEAPKTVKKPAPKKQGSKKKKKK